MSSMPSLPVIFADPGLVMLFVTFVRNEIDSKLKRRHTELTLRDVRSYIYIVQVKTDSPAAGVDGPSCPLCIWMS